MKILQVNVVYDVGSTGKITADLHRELLRNGHESIVCCSRLKGTDDANVINLCGVTYSHFNVALNAITGYPQGGCYLSTKKLIKIIQKEKPDIVHLQCINGAFVNMYKLLAFLKEQKIKTVCTLHAEFMYTGGCGHSRGCESWKTGCVNCERFREETRSLFFCRTHSIWKKLFEIVPGFSELTLVPVSNWIADRVADSPIYEGIPQKVIHNGINTQQFIQCDASQKEQIKKQFGIPADKKIVLHVTPNFSSDIKGGEYFAALAEQLPEDYQAVVVGISAPQTERIIGISYLENPKELAMLYAIADVMVITSKVDNYPTVCLEANCCGTPVVGFNVGGVKETIGDGMGEVVPPFDMDALREKTIHWSQMKHSIPQSCIQSRIEYCSKERMLSEYLELYSHVMSNEK